MILLGSHTGRQNSTQGETTMRLAALTPDQRSQLSPDQISRMSRGALLQDGLDIGGSVLEMILAGTYLVTGDLGGTHVDANREISRWVLGGFVFADGVRDFVNGVKNYKEDYKAAYLNQK